jgi:hypothetical protein
MVLGAAAGHRGDAKCSQLTSTGFPLRLDVACRGLTLSNGASFELPALLATAPLYWPVSFESSASGPLKVSDGAESAVTVSWANATTHLRAGLFGLREAEAIVGGVDTSGVIELPRLAVSRVSADKLELKAAPSGKGSYRAGFDAAGVALEASDNRPLPEIAAAGQVTLKDFGGSLGFNPRAKVGRWIKKGGGFHLDHLAMTAGPVTANASGDFTLSREGLLSGKIVIRFTGLEKLPEVLEAFLPGSRTATQLARVLMVVTRKVETEGNPARETTLNVSDGHVSFGIVPIATLPAIRF